MASAETGLDLERLAARDPTVAPLARLQAVALRAAEDPAWTEGLPDLAAPPPEPAAPRLHGARLVVNGDRLRALFGQLAATLDAGGHPEGGRLARFFASPAFDPIAALHASLVHEASVLEGIASCADADGAVLAVVAQAAALPLLAACGRHAASGPATEPWPCGYCPVCAAWPTLAEVRGLARALVLRCGRCGSEWPYEHRRCPFCGQRAQQRQRYFAPEAEREMRQAITCDACRGYIKVLATLGPLAHAEVLVRDLDSLELDVVALDQGYHHPAGLGWALSLAVEAAPRRSGWLRWRR